MTAAPDFTQLIIGTYTERMPHVDGKADGITGVSCGPAGLVAPALLARARNPSFLAVSTDGRHLYAVNETTGFGGQPGGGVTSYARDPATGSLRELAVTGSLGDEPAHIAIDPSGAFVLVANYGPGSVAVFPREDGGTLGPPTDHVQHTGSGPHPDRQTGPHTHMVAFDPVTGDVLVPDLGADAVVVYEATPAGRLAERPGARIAAASGTGPRHLAFHPGGDVLFLVSELDNTLTALRRAGRRFEPVASAATLPAGFTATSHAAAVRVAPSGRYVYVSNRAETGGSIAVIRFGEPAGGLELASVVSSQGSGPRDLVVTSGGRHLLVANTTSDTVVMFEVDEDGPSLRPVSSVPVPSPACLLAL